MVEVSALKTIIKIKDKKVTSTLNLEDGTYNISLTKVSDDKTLEQTRKLWATCSDISEKIYGTKANKDIIYLQVLRMAGQRTYRLTIAEELLDDFKKQKGVKCVSVLSREVINHRAIAYIEACMVGISEMTKKEVSKVIESCVHYADEVGVVPQIKEEYDN